jgi:hypothetical protein
VEFALQPHSFSSRSEVVEIERCAGITDDTHDIVEVAGAARR